MQSKADEMMKMQEEAVFVVLGQGEELFRILTKSCAPSISTAHTRTVYDEMQERKRQEEEEVRRQEKLNAQQEQQTVVCWKCKPRRT